MALPSFTMRQLLEAGVHFGHNTRRWNPKMAPFLFGKRNGIHIIDLGQTVPMMSRAMEAVRDVVARGGRVLFVGTKRQAAEKVAETATGCGQYFVNHRWLGGMLTNWQTISGSIKRLRDLEAIFDSVEKTEGLTKKELLQLTRERNKLELALGGIKDMGGKPDILVVIDTNKEETAVAEAVKLGIPVVGILDSNSNPDNIDYPIPGNDDAIRAITTYCELMAGAVLDGIQSEVGRKGDLGAAANPVVNEKLPPAKETEEKKAKKSVKDAIKAVAAKVVPEATAATTPEAKPEAKPEATPETPST